MTDHPNLPARDPSRPITPTELGRLQQARAQAQAWADSCELDVLAARQKLDKLLDEQRTAQAALELTVERYEDERRLASNPAALRRVG